MTFGQKIKSLRREANMTQENLAELLSISPQAISRWETDVAMPDISLLPPLANLFNVTTDYLLGMETYQKDLRKAEFDEAFHKYWEHDDKEKNYQIALRAVAEYPGNMEYVEWLASAEYYVAMPTLDNSEYTRLLESSAKHYNWFWITPRIQNYIPKRCSESFLHLAVIKKRTKPNNTLC